MALNDITRRQDGAEQQGRSQYTIIPSVGLVVAMLFTMLSFQTSLSSCFSYVA